MITTTFREVARESLLLRLRKSAQGYAFDRRKIAWQPGFAIDL